MHWELVSNLYSLDFRKKGSPNNLIMDKGNKVSYSLNDNNSSTFNEVETSSRKSLRIAEGNKGKSSERSLRAERNRGESAH